MKILYCMHVGWNWIKQRPHFLAEELSKRHKVVVISDYCYRVHSKAKKEKKDNLSLREFYKIPIIDRYPILSNVNVLYRRAVYKHYAKKESPDFIYVMTPSAERCISKKYEGNIIYDCMDDMVQFSENLKVQEKVKREEKKLIDRARNVLVSSEHLKEVLLKRYGNENSGKYIVLRNAHVFDDFDTFVPKNRKREKLFTLCYFGTIAEWFDFDLVRTLLDKHPELRLKLIGPYQAGTRLFEHPQVENIGSVKHEQLKAYVDDADAFIMPFQVTELILSVDPVKLYEYIYFNKDILCVGYPEVERFQKFAYFYNGMEECEKNLQELLKKADNRPKYTLQERTEFLEKNTWKCRAEVINTLLKKESE